MPESYTLLRGESVSIQSDKMSFNGYRAGRRPWWAPNALHARVTKVHKDSFDAVFDVGDSIQSSENIPFSSISYFTEPMQHYAEFEEEEEEE